MAEVCSWKAVAEYANQKYRTGEKHKTLKTGLLIKNNLTRQLAPIVGTSISTIYVEPGIPHSTDIQLRGKTKTLMKNHDRC